MRPHATPHFAIREFDCHDGVEYPESWIEERLKPLCVVLERVRLELGNPIGIVSGYRSPEHNQAIGGVSASQHMQGRAADIVVNNHSPEKVYGCILRLFRAGAIEIGGLGVYNSWVHIDVRPRPDSGHLAQWTGVTFGSEQA
jgi:uncharacterized protein YcbK (DUF882 family)